VRGRIPELQRRELDGRGCFGWSITFGKETQPGQGDPKQSGFPVLLRFPYPTRSQRAR